jgi:chromate transporter
MTNGQASAPTVSLDALFFAFLKVAFCGLGSGVVWARRIAVEQSRWVNEEEFADILSLCQFMPGPNVVGIAVCVGAKVRGLAGAIAAACGFVFLPLTVGLLVGVLYLEHAHLPVLQKILAGVSSAAAGLLIATGIRMLIPHRRRPQAWIVAASALGGIAFAKLPLFIVLLGATLLSIVLARFEEARIR